MSHHRKHDAVCFYNFDTPTHNYSQWHRTLSDQPNPESKNRLEMTDRDSVAQNLNIPPNSVNPVNIAGGVVHEFKPCTRYTLDPTCSRISHPASNLREMRPPQDDSMFASDLMKHAAAPEPANSQLLAVQDYCKNIHSHLERGSFLKK